MAVVCNLGRADPTLRIILGIGLGITGILIDGLPGRLFGILGALLILSASRGT